MPPSAAKLNPNVPTHAVVMGDLIHSEDASAIATLDEGYVGVFS